VSDLCADRDTEVNHVLREKVFPWQTTVIRSDDFLRAIGSKIIE
jgi:hypothetical protein